MSLAGKTANQLHELLKRGETTATAIIESVYQQIEKVEPKVHAYITLTKESALQKAAEIDKEIKSGKPIQPLTGIPIAVKDVLCTKGVQTTCGSHILKGFIPPYTGT